MPIRVVKDIKFTKCLLWSDVLNDIKASPFFVDDSGNIFQEIDCSDNLRIVTFEVGKGHISTPFEILGENTHFFYIIDMTDPVGDVRKLRKIDSYFIKEVK